MIAKKVCKKFGTKEVLKDVSFEIVQGDKVGLVGKNGSGKSTLLKILSGEIAADSGEISQALSVGYLKQEVAIEDYGLTIDEYIRKETGLGELEERLHKLEENLDETNMDEYDEVLNRFLACDGYNLDVNIETLINGLKLNKRPNSIIGELSGGEKIKVLLMSVLLGEFDVLLLDEPTNNLDIESIAFLENFIKLSKKAMIMVSHDEAFLEKVTTKIFELKDGVLTSFPYNYSVYAEMSELEYQKKLSEYLETREKQAELRERLETIQRKSNSSASRKASDNDKIGHDFKVGKGQQRSGALVKKITKQLDETRVDPEFRERETYHFFVQEEQGKSASRDIVMTELVCGYEDFKTPELTMTINYGDRVLIEGPNGSGKTTVINTILGEIAPKSGEVKVGSGVRIGYIEQNTIVNKDSTETMFEYVTKNLENIDTGFVFTVLNNFQIEYEDRNKPYVDFSAGERTKINLAKLALEKVNILVLDEPTNHLDIEATKILYEAIDSFNGTIIAISHNRRLIERLQHNVSLNMSTGKLEYVSSLNP